MKLMPLDRGRKVTASRPNSAQTPEADSAEADVERWLDAMRDAAQELPEVGAITSIGLSGQMHGVVPRKRGVGAIRPAILGADQRGTRSIRDVEPA